MNGWNDRCEAVAVSEARVQAPVGHQPSDHRLPCDLASEDDPSIGLEREIQDNRRRISGWDRSDAVVAEGRVK